MLPGSKNADCHESLVCQDVFAGLCLLIFAFSKQQNVQPCPLFQNNGMFNIAPSFQTRCKITRDAKLLVLTRGFRHARTHTFYFVQCVISYSD